MKSVSIERDITTVSYTHLDVYKRHSYYEEEIDGIEVSAIPFFFDN